MTDINDINQRLTRIEQLVLELADLFPLTDKENDIKDPQ